MRPRPIITERELEVAKLLAAGKSLKEVAMILGTAIYTVNTQRAEIYRKLEVHSIVELTHYAIAHGWVPVLYAAPEKPPCVTIWLVQSGAYEDQWIEGVFSSLELAEKYAKAYNDFHKPHAMGKCHVIAVTWVLDKEWRPA